jgi:hypothetical protein
VEPAVYGRAGVAAYAETAPVIAVPISEETCRTVVARSADERLELVKYAAANKGYKVEPDPEVKDQWLLTSCGDGDALIAIVFSSAAEEARAGLLPADVAPVYVVELRSFEQIIYYLGEQLRDPTRMTCVNPPGWAGAPAWPKKGPLFRVYEDVEGHPLAGGDYAARLNYRGHRVWAGPAVPQGTPVQHGWTSGWRDCSRAPTGADRTSTVLTLLTEIYSRAASPEALRAPSRFISD